MAINTGMNTPKKGMNRSSAGFEITESEYTFAYNANFHDEYGTGQINLQNEPSNVYCSGFKEGYKVVGHKFHLGRDRTYFFLTNPSTNCSEIGYISSISNADSLEALSDTCGCNLQVILEDPLEGTVQKTTCEYITLISDYCEITGECSGCLNFSIDRPIHESNIHIKDELTGSNLYWTDSKIPRYLQIDNLSIYTQDIDDCTGDILDTCFQCDKLRIFPLRDKLCIRPRSIQGGGNLSAGMYEVTAVYCDYNGNELSDYYSKTNMIPIHDPNNNILDQTNLNYSTNLAIGIDITNADKDFEYYKVVVIYKSGLDASVTSFENGIYPIDTERVTISTSVDKPKIDLSDIISRRTIYKTAEGFAEGNGYLFQYGMESHREINLQQVMNLAGAFAKWNTVQAKEGIYTNGVTVSNYLSYMRDEVVPFSIKFYEEGGFETANFPFVPRPPSEEELQELGGEYSADPNTESILEYNPTCSENNRNKRWQFENTAKVEGVCTVSESIDTITTIAQEQLSCVQEDSLGNTSVVETIFSGSIVIDTQESLEDYINTNSSTIQTSTESQWATIQNILNNPGNYSGGCEPEFPNNCDNTVEVSSKMFAIGTATENSSSVLIPFNQQGRIHEPSECSVFIEPEIQDTSFINSYMPLDADVKFRTNTKFNTSCTTAEVAELYTDNTVDNIFHLQNMGSEDANDLWTNYTTSATSSTFSGFVFENALWYEVPLDTPNVIFEVSSTPNGDQDDNTGNQLRLSVFDGCATNDMSSYSRIITDVTLANDPNKVVQLTSSDFTGDTAMIAIDAELARQTFIDVEFNEDSGSLSIGSQNYNIPNQDTPEESVEKFIKKKASKILNQTGLGAFDNGESVLLAVPIGSAVPTVTIDEGEVTVREVFRLRPPSGCINAFRRPAPVINTVTFTGLTFGKEYTYQSDCSYTQAKLTDCEPVPHKYGTFGYWESEIKYPCNSELYNSSDLEIAEDDIPDSIRTEFENYFSDGLSGGNYILNDNTDLRNKGIRHYKFPCSKTIPFMSSTYEAPGPFVESVIYPIGFSIDPEVIRTFLDIAVKNNLLTLEERNRITKYEIFRGDRSVDKSIVAKGLLFDIYEYEEIDSNKVYYPSFPLNSLGTDPWNGNVPHRGNSIKNNLFTFHSPDTSFYKPTLPSEMKIEGYQMGYSSTYFDVVKDHPTYVILGPRGYTLATILAVTEVILEITIKGLEYFLQASAAGTLPGVPLAAVAAGLAVAGLVGSLFRVGKLRYEWIETLTNLGHPEQFAYYSATIGHYNKFLANPIASSQLRGIATSQYIKEGRWEVAEETTGNHLRINNMDRSDSVFLGLGPADDYWINYPTQYVSWDNSFFDIDTSSSQIFDGEGKSSAIEGRAASPYVSLKEYLPSQYGSLNSINWLSTGYCGDINKEVQCDPIFGGDTYISRFTPKRKFPYFTSNAFGLAPLTPYKYSDYININPGTLSNRSYIDYLINDAANNYSFGGFVFPTPKSKYNLFFDETDNSSIYVLPPAKFLVFSYGFPNFLVESQFNGNYRYAKREPHENFYPNIKDVIEFTQEKNVSIRQPNKYYYNFVYSTIPTRSPWRMLPGDYSESVYSKLSDASNTIIYSGQDKSENSLVDPWLNYKPLDAYQFPTSYGKLIDVEGIESEQMLGRFQNGMTIFGAIDVLRDRLTSDNSRLGSGGIFSGRNINFNETDLGYAGTQHVAKVSCEFGHFWADAKRGEVFQLEPNGKGLGQITTGMEEWFKDHLPFKIKKSFPTLTDKALDNAFKGLGLTMAWDARSKRVFLTKLDYTPVAGAGVTEKDGRFYISERDQIADIEVFLHDTKYFTNCSFTIAYSPLTKSWISYYGFHPNYYIGYEGYFQTGKNYAEDETELGIWSHLPFFSSYQVFYGKLQPFIIEYSLPTKGINSTLHSIDYWLDVRKYYNKYDVVDIYGYGYNKAFIYNNYQNSGQLNLIYKKENDLSQEFNYPRHNVDSTDILQSEISGKYTFNYLYNTVKNERGGLPIWINDSNQIHKTLNLPLLNMKSQFKDRLKGDYFTVSLQQDKESRYKMIHRFSTNKRDFR